MTSLLMKVALAAALTLASVLGLVGISGLIIFADLKSPEPAAVVQGQFVPSAAIGSRTFTVPNQ
jgi:hypothetical protein